MKFIHKMLAWYWYNKSDQYNEMGWPEESLKAAERAIAHEKKGN